ncbi:hypothetical protein BD779DRAFT_1668419 [Infundibulicybe gibba]|nr:hypothetical protein BD779DRAFT_1668419 [Infundibulicybe gibba]
MAAAYAAKRVHNPRKPMTFCGNYMLGGLCPRGNSCWNSHSLVDTARIDRIAGNPKYSAHKPLVSITRDHSGLWEVVLRARFIDKTLRTLGTPIYACCDTLHDALTSVENKCISEPWLPE